MSQLTDDELTKHEKLIASVAAARKKLQDAQTVYFMANSGSPLADSSVLTYERARTEAMIAEQDLEGFRKELLRKRAAS